MDYYLATKNNKIMSFAATWMQLEIIIPSEFRKRKTDPYLYVETVQMNLYKQKQTHRHGDQTCGCQVGGRGGASWESAGRCKHLEWLNKVLLYIVQETIMEKNIKKKYMRKTESLCCKGETGTVL